MSDRLSKLTQLLAVDPTDAFVLYGLATEHAKLGNVTEAISYFDRCLAADPNYLYAHYHKAKTLADHDRVPDAITVLQTAIPAARSAGDAKALSELTTLLDTIT
ncbi:MAG: tetratricopeptide repeat protein [Phycisphaerales bacterium]|nr:tetratricopeptide repeat protein [Phycisphaerales bacterium]